MAPSVCNCSAHQNVVLLVNAMDWDLTYKDLIKKIVYNRGSNKCIMQLCKSCPGTSNLKEFLDQELNDHKDDELRIQQYWQHLQPLNKEYKETLINVNYDLTRHSYITNLKITSSWYMMKSKASTRVKNTASYIPWLYTTWDQMVASIMIHCVLVLMTTTITQPFCIKFQKIWQL